MKDIKAVKLSDANQNFSKVTRSIEEGNAVIIEKNGEEKFVVISIDEYRRLRNECFWATEDDGSFTRFECSSDYVHTYGLTPLGNDLYKYVRIRLPRNVLNVSFNGDDIEMDLDAAIAMSMRGRDAMLAYNAEEVNLSPKHIAGLNKARDREELKLIVEAQDLLKSFKEDKEIHPEMLHRMASGFVQE